MIVTTYHYAVARRLAGRSGLHLVLLTRVNVTCRVSVHHGHKISSDGPMVHRTEKLDLSASNDLQKWRARVAVAYLGLRWSPCNYGSDRWCNGRGCTEGGAGDATVPAATAPPPATRVRPPRSRQPRPPAPDPSPPPVASSPLQRSGGCGLRWMNVFFFWQVRVR